LPTDDDLYPAEEENGHNSGGRGRKKSDDNGGGATCSGRRVGPRPRPRPLVSGGLVITAEGPSFLYHQVRLMVATLRAVGAGELAADQMAALLAARDPAAVPAMVGGAGRGRARTALQAFNDTSFSVSDCKRQREPCYTR